MKFGYSTVLSLGLTSLFLGCTYLAENVIDKPKLSLDKVDVRNAHASGATVVFGVEVDNPNPFGIRVDALKYDVEIAGKALSSGRIDKPAMVAASSKSIVEIPVPVKYSEVFSSVMDFVSKGTSNYRLKGEATFGVLTVPFEKTGDLKLK